MHAPLNAPAKTRLDVRLIETEDDLLALEEPWRALHALCPDATPFQSPAWLLPWWAAFHPGRLATLAVWSGDRLAGLCPLYREDGAEGPRLLPLGIGISDVCGVLAEPAAEEAVAAHIAESLAATALPVLWTDLPGSALAARLPAPPGWTIETGAGTPCPIIPLAGARLCDDGMPDAVPAAKRRKVRMAGNRAQARGGARPRALEAMGAASFLAVLEELHGLRWRSRGEPGVLQDARVRAFHRVALPRLIADGLADGEVLDIEGRPAAAFYGLCDRHASYAYLGGIDPAFERESPGTLAIARAIQRAATRGAALFNLLRGQEAYKYDWGARDAPLSWHRMTPPA